MSKRRVFVWSVFAATVLVAWKKVKSFVRGIKKSREKIERGENEARWP